MPNNEDITGRFECLLPKQESVTGPRDQGVLTMLRGPAAGHVYTLDRPSTTIGRSPDADIVVPDQGLSRLHARILRTPSGFLFEDLGSTNGSFVEGERALSARPLNDGLRILMGTQTLFAFDLHDEMELSAARMTRDLTVRDPLTRLYNRRYLNEQLESESAYARRHGVAMSVLLIDIDHFKQINDQYGHITGDAVLRALAAALQQTVRSEDVLSRYGGEEFVALARRIDEAGALAFGERIRSSAREVRVDGPLGPIQLTVSVGIGHAPIKRPTDPETLLQAADEAMYRAKEGGRDRVVLLPVKRSPKRSGPVPVSNVKSPAESSG